MPIRPRSAIALLARALDAVGQGAESTADWTAPDAVDPSALPHTAGGDVGVTPSDTDDSLVRVAPGETQAVTVLRDGADVTSFALDLPDGFRAVPRGAGYDIVAALGSGSGSISAGHIADPWAVDAAGRPIPTRFALEGDTLVQTIDAEGAAYPVVVDPLVTFGLANAPQGVGFYVNLLGSQMREVTAASAVLLGLGGYAICKTSRIPTPVARFVHVGCDLVGGTDLLAIVALVQRIYSSHRFGYFACYQTRIGSGRDFVWTEHANCA
ncbi:hypothetical protein C5C03_01160 [Clavibacter michiganensis]|uniref:hypothetical protein n=1 Tax=Clavibacter michiganensis TaxID=28447 RepID=UPI000CE7D695|nr:hypothetical protein [Clavibacter michiganensis]PPF90529.1 hypothetical protein C5C03_01160 [Clavibacter michiganensis]PPF99059.1 hypothetical protein C5C05_02880 [Clavibacter michiganensis]